MLNNRFNPDSLESLFMSGVPTPDPVPTPALPPVAVPVPVPTLPPVFGHRVVVVFAGILALLHAVAAVLNALNAVPIPGK